MSKFVAVLAVVLALLAAGEPARAQFATPDPRLAASIGTIQAHYATSFVGISQLFNGPEYVDYTRWYHAHIGHQFFQSPEEQPGSVHYNGFLFTNLRLNYDVVRDQLVLPQPTSPLSLSLHSERVRSFDLNGHHFIRLVADSASSKFMRTGFYEVLVDSTCQVLAKRSKRMQEQIKEQNIDIKFLVTDKLFVEKGGTYYPVANKGAAMRLFADRSKEMQQYLAEHRLKFKKNQLEALVVQLARYYNGLPR